MGNVMWTAAALQMPDYCSCSHHAAVHAVHALPAQLLQQTTLQELVATQTGSTHDSMNLAVPSCRAVTAEPAEPGL